jgi:hypothetical protein
LRLPVFTTTIGIANWRVCSAPEATTPNRGTAKSSSEKRTSFALILMSASPVISNPLDCRRPQWAQNQWYLCKYKGKTPKVYQPHLSVYGQPTHAAIHEALRDRRLCGDEP